MKTFGLADKISDSLDSGIKSKPTNYKNLDSITDEKKLIASGFKELIKLEEQSLKKLTSIHNWVMFFGILTIIGVAAGIIAGIAALAH